MTVTFLYPGFLLLLLLLPLLWWRRASLDRARCWWRAVVFLLVIFAVAMPVWRSREAARQVVFILDQSASPGTAARRRARDLLRESLKNLDAGVLREVVVLGDPGAELASFAPVTFLGQKGSNLAAALDRAALSIQEGMSAAVVVISDGASDDPLWGDAVQDLTSRGIPVHTMSLKGTPAALMPLDLHVAGELRQGEAVTARVEVTPVSVKSPLKLTLLEEDEVVFSMDNPGLSSDGMMEFSFRPQKAGFRRFTLRLAEEGKVAHGVSRIMAVQEPRQVLYLGQRVQGGGEALAKLAGPGFQLEPGTVASAFDAFDLVVVDDLPAGAFPKLRQEALLRAVEDQGVGLLVCGGPASFGPGGYQGEPLAAALPVRLLQKEEKRDPSTSLVVIIDTSGSMGGTRVQLAKEVARLAMRRLLPHDKVGIVEFYGAKRWAAPLQPASNVIEIQRALNRLQAGGGTVIMPALEEAYYGLQNVNTRYKHVLVLTDGGVESGAFEPLIRRMADKGVNVSTVLVGPEAHSEFLVNLSQWGKGRFYAVPNRFNLPEVILKQPTSSRLPAWRQGSFSLKARGARIWWGDIEPASIPPLDAFVELSRRRGAEVILETSGGKNPVLASWMYGQGRITTFASELTGPGTATWSPWRDHGAFVQRILRNTVRHDGAAMTYRLRRAGQNLLLAASSRRAFDHRPSARFQDGQTWIPVTFHRRSPLESEARLFWPRERPFLCVADLGRGRGFNLVDAAPVPDDREFQVPADARLSLELLSRESGGVHVRDGESLKSLRMSSGRGVLRWHQLAHWLFLGALLAYLGDVFFRRRDPGAQG